MPGSKVKAVLHDRYEKVAGSREVPMLRFQFNWKHHPSVVVEGERVDLAGGRITVAMPMGRRAPSLTKESCRVGGVWGSMLSNVVATDTGQSSSNRATRSPGAHGSECGLQFLSSLSSQHHEGAHDENGLSILLALLMTGVLMFAYWLHMPHRLWMKWKRTRQVRHFQPPKPPWRPSVAPCDTPFWPWQRATLSYPSNMHSTATKQ